MTRAFLVGLAGGVGATGRYALGQWAGPTRFPWVTLAINLTGAFALGLLLTVAVGHLSDDVRIPLGVGLLGGFTTFSAFAWEGLTLSRDGRATTAGLYVVASVGGGLLAAWLGLVLGRAVR